MSVPVLGQHPARHATAPHPSGPSRARMRLPRWAAVSWVIAGLVIFPLVSMVLPDPLWIPGIYDGGDGDDLALGLDPGVGSGRASTEAALAETPARKSVGFVPRRTASLEGSLARSPPGYRRGPVLSRPAWPRPSPAPDSLIPAACLTRLHRSPPHHPRSAGSSHPVARRPQGGPVPSTPRKELA